MMLSRRTARRLAAVALIVAVAIPHLAAAAPADPRDNLRPAYGSTWSGPFLDPVDQQAEALIRALEGRYSGHWPGAFSKRPDVDQVEAWAVWKRVQLPSFGRYVLLHIIREGGPTGRVLRERLVSISDDPSRSHNFMAFYVTLDFARFGDADIHPEKLAGLTPDDLAYFGRGCQVNVIGDKGGFDLTAERSSCVLVYPDGKARYNQFQYRVYPGGFSFFEAAYDMDGNFLAGSRGGPSVFTRLP